MLDAGDEVTGFNLGLPAVLHLIVTGETQQLPGLGEEAHVEIEIADAQFKVLDAAVVAFEFRAPGGGEMIELPLGEFVKGGLVVFEGEEIVGPGLVDDQRRFFWACRASPVMTALTRQAETSSAMSCWLTGSSQSAFSPV